MPLETNEAIARPTAETTATITKISNRVGKACPIYWINIPRPAPAPSINPQTPVLSLTGHEMLIFFTPCKFN